MSDTANPRIKKDVYKKIMLLKIDRGFKSYSETVKYLLDICNLIGEAKNAKEEEVHENSQDSN